MSEIREELEHFAKLAEEKQSSKETFQSEKLPDNNSFQEIKDYLEAPKGYDKELAETFCELPDKWRRYLHSREAELDKGFGELLKRTGEYKWLDDIFSSRAEELQKNGINNPKEWLQNIISVDAMLSKDPKNTISMLAKAYGIGSVNNFSYSAPLNQSHKLSDIMSEHIVAKQLNDFIEEVDDKGSLKHPYYRDVVLDMHDLINKGIAKNLSDAYEMAVWLNSNTRAKLIAERTKENLELKSKNAQKSKDASFALKGKAPINTKDLTLREELEMRFAELEDDN